MCVFFYSLSHTKANGPVCLTGVKNDSLIFQEINDGFESDLSIFIWLVNESMPFII